MLKKMLCDEDKALSDILKVINENAKGVAFIVDRKNRLCGLITDGDIRRLLLEGHKIQEIAKDIVPKNFVYANISDSMNEILAKISHKVKIIPIVDKEFRVVDYFEYKAEINFPVASPDLTGNELKYMTDAFLSTWISSSGKYIDRFEGEFSSYIGCEFGVATSNGTVALHLALLALGIGSGDEVIVPNFTFAAPANVVIHSNATPVLVDVENDSWCIDPIEIEKAISPRTKAIIVVHLYGQPCEMEAIMEISKKHNLFIIEDCAEAHGAEFNGKKVGSFGDISCFSFFGNKVITTGEGGMCVTNSRKFNDKMKLLRDHGMSKEKKYWHEIIGYNYRITNLQASIGCAQLERIETILTERNNIEKKYHKYLHGLDHIKFQRNDLNRRKKITWLVTILVKNNKRDEYMMELTKNGIDSRPVFYALSEMPIYKDYVFSKKNSEKISKEGLNLPTIPGNRINFENIKKILSK